MGPPNNRLIAVWLLICCLLVFSMILLGGVTRLTQSGLSMVEWDPIMGVIPPLNNVEWQETFERYQAYPEYQLVNRNMTLTEFKRIFYVEYAHRMLGRAIAVVFLLPLLLFAVTRQLSGRLAMKLMLIFLLGALQGLLGWYMVQSGLVDQPHVSPYRLTAHFMLAILILGYMLWIVFGLLSRNYRPSGDNVPVTVKYYGWVVLFAVVFMMFTGGFVAGTKAGYAFNTFPKMYDRWVPEGLWAMQPIWRNFFENIPTVQFVHRCMALLLAILTIGFCVAVRHYKVDYVRLSCNVLLLLVAVQIGLGISTLVFNMPVPLAVAHQGGALILFSLTLFVTYRLSHIGTYRRVRRGAPNGTN